MTPERIVRERLRGAYGMLWVVVGVGLFVLACVGRRLDDGRPMSTVGIALTGAASLAEVGLGVAMIFASRKDRP